MLSGQRNCRYRHSSACKVFLQIKKNEYLFVRLLSPLQKENKFVGTIS